MLARILMLCAVVCGPGSAAAQSNSSEFPTKLITIVVPYPAGGSADILARVVADRVRSHLQQPAIVENRAGATGSLGATIVARAEPDGYTLLSSPNAPIVLNPFISKDLRYDATSFVPIVQLASAPLVIAVRNGLPATNLQEFIAYAEANPGKLNYASQGVGGGAHLATLLLEQATGIQLVHIPFAGSAPAIQAVAGGQVDLFIDNIGTALPLHKSGNLKILAIGSAQRLPELQEVPTLEEAGLKDVDFTTWYGLFAPAKTPDTVVHKLNHAVNDILKEDNIKARFGLLGLQPTGGTSQTFGRFVETDRARWKAIIEAANLSK
jgi:tripartite-type tricarboxylate transporter receptor subunit TctC